MVAEEVVDDDPVAGLEAGRPHRDAPRDDPDPGGGEEKLVGRTSGNDLGVAGDDRHVGQIRRARASKR